MIFKSIKWRLQIWYGLILVLVLAGFGFTAYQLERGRQLRRVDDELQHRFSLVASALHRPPRAGELPFDRPPHGQHFNADLPEQNPPRTFRLPPEAITLFSTNNPNNFYYRISLIVENGEIEIARSENFPQSLPAIVTSDYTFNPLNHVNSSSKKPRPPRPVDFQDNHVIRNFLPSGEFIEVGCSIAPELKELHRTALKFFGVGGIILIFGLAGGWFFVRRAIRPIEQISSTAVKISAGDLSQRISVAETQSELGQLAAVLNSTFARLESAFAQQKQFASDAAHELRTPVSVILTQTQTALNRERNAEDYKQTVEACQRAAQRMRKLISALLELARFDSGQEILKRARFDFSKTISDCVELVKPIAEERGVKFFFELSPLEISGDSERLAQVVTNLLTNAIQYNHDDGEVRVALESQNGLGILKISDNGLGIAPEDLPRIFERFYRADKSRSSGNAGLGLAISKAIIDAHGGTIEVAGNKNVGVTFIVRLPITSA